MEKRYRIIVKLPDIKLSFSIDDYEILNSGYYKIWDEKTRTYRIFDSRICEIIDGGEHNVSFYSILLHFTPFGVNIRYIFTLLHFSPPFRGERKGGVKKYVGGEK